MVQRLVSVGVNEYQTDIVAEPLPVQILVIAVFPLIAGAVNVPSVTGRAVEQVVCENKPWLINTNTRNVIFFILNVFKINCKVELEKRYTLLKEQQPLHLQLIYLIEAFCNYHL